MVMYYQIVVNTWQTKSTPWTVKWYDGIADGVDKLPDVREGEVDFVELASAIERMPVKIWLPPTFSGIPRYYLIAFQDARTIVDIIGIRNDLTPTKWSYTKGYWHPQCNVAIANTLRKHKSA